MALDPDHRADALARIAVLEARLQAHAQAAGELREQLGAVRAAVDAIPPAPVTAPAPLAAPEPAPAPAGDDADLAGARLVALDMVMSGVPRDAAVLRLAADFPGIDVATLLDEAATSRG